MNRRIVISLGAFLAIAFFADRAAAQMQLAKSTEFMVTVKGSTEKPVWDSIKQLELGRDPDGYGWYLRIAGVMTDKIGSSINGCLLKSAASAPLFDIQRAILVAVPYEGVISVRCGNAVPHKRGVPIVDLDDKRPGAASFYIVFGPK